MTGNLLPERQALIRQLFADINGALELAHAFAETEQSQGRSPGKYGRCARRLQAATDYDATLVVALRTLLYPANEHRDDRA